MNRIITALFCLLVLSNIAKAQLKKFPFVENKMGSPFQLIIETDDSLKARNLAEQAFQLVDSLVHIFSDYDSTSELSRLSASAGKNPMVASSTLWNILQEAKKGFNLSKGSFDITVGPLSHLWRKARKLQVFPDSLAIEEARNKVGFQYIVFDQSQQTVYLTKSGMLLDLGGIAKGYVAQEVINYLLTKGVQSALADAGGDIVVSDAPTKAKGWTIGINVPETTDELLPKKLLIKNIAVTTSGDVYQFIEHNGKKYSHIVDPRTGYGISSQRNVTVIAKRGIDADWLTKVCSILPIDEARKIVAVYGAEMLITVAEKTGVKYYTSKGFAKYWKK